MSSLFAICAQIWIIISYFGIPIEAAITSATVTPASLVAGATGQATIALTTSINVPINGQIYITFPSGFIIASSAISSVSGIDALSTVTFSGNIAQVTVKNSAMSAGSVSFNVNGITNSGATTTGTYAFATYDTTPTLLESGTSASGSTITVLSLTTTMTSLNTTAGGTAGYAISITNTVAIPMNGYITVTVPTRFGIPATPTIANKVNIDLRVTLTVTSIASNTITIQLTRYPIVPGTFSFQLDGVTNPGASCSSYYPENCATTWETYQIKTTDTFSNPYQQNLALTGTAIYKSFLRYGKVRTAVTTTSTLTTATITLNIVTAIPVGGQIQVVFPSSFTVGGSPTVSLWNGINALSTSATGSGQQVTLTIAGSAVPISNGGSFRIDSITTPALTTATGSYTIRTTDTYGSILEESVTIDGVGCNYVNQCSGHGDCTLMSGTCICHTGWGAPTDVATYKAFDCSFRSCPSFASWNSVPTGSSTGHSKLEECAGVGTCDRSTGRCNCFPGFEGKACERMSCPNNCSGHGKCLSMAQLAITTNAFPLSAATTYSGSISTTWDANRIYQCVCDSSWEVGLGANQRQLSEYFGADCSLRRCPSGNDPATTVDETNCNGIAMAQNAGVGSSGNLCHVDCSNRGVCMYQTGTCRCFDSFTGSNCGTIDVLHLAKNFTELEKTYFLGY